MNTFNTVGHVAHFEQQQHMSKGPRGGMPSNVGSSYGGGPGQMQSFQGNQQMAFANSSAGYQGGVRRMPTMPAGGQMAQMPQTFPR